MNATPPRILIVTVIYNQKITDSNVFRSLLSKRMDVFIYDNSPTPQPHSGLPKNWTYISDPSNPGLSKAYNTAARFAVANGYNWLLITDQDTSFPPGAIDTYRLYAEKNEQYRMFIPKVLTAGNRYLSPVKAKRYSAHISESAPSGKILLKGYAVINSGTLVTTDSFISCGGYNEDVFLDFSDFQFMERFAAKYHTAYVMDMECTQDFSNISDSADKKLTRFRLFCLSLSGYSSLRRFGRLELAAIVLRRAASLCLATRTLKPLGILFRYYRPLNHN